MLSVALAMLSVVNIHLFAGHSHVVFGVIQVIVGVHLGSGHTRDSPRVGVRSLSGCLLVPEM